MTSPNRNPSLEDVLDALFQQDNAPTPEMIVQACQAHAEYREEILEFSALWMAQDALPEPAESELEVSDASVMRLQSRVLNQLYAPPVLEGADAVRKAIGALAGQRLRSAAQATGVGSTVLLSKILTRMIIDPPRAVLDRLAQFLNVTVTLLSEELGPQVALHRSYKAADKPTMTAGESWEDAISALAVDEAEKARLRAMQDRGRPS
ncbi:MAG: hypothetical protein IPK54_01360 [Dokdonella sp.]|uniref:hypothetical protein n=1 Tax=Dokdonella sp. TaxID=2291710 RepID=UPI00095E07B8|nr:hypothetical protein [Dokdonella sp.]MBK8122232.1 hypothetical protein [Dokdonella sp.]OJY87666.1 MAG: hypothetical protein BGP25_00700 [Xanthomonadales bacterium 63-13]